MPRPDRGMAQRYAARKRKKRASAGRGLAPRVEPLGPAAAASPLREAAPAVSRPESNAVGSTSRPAPATRPRVIQRRPFSSYADEYRYVLADLRRVAAVASSLLLVLV